MTENIDQILQIVSAILAIVIVIREMQGKKRSDTIDAISRGIHAFRNIHPTEGNVLADHIKQEANKAGVAKEAKKIKEKNAPKDA